MFLTPGSRRKWLCTHSCSRGPCPPSRCNYWTLALFLSSSFLGLREGGPHSHSPIWQQHRWGGRALPLLSLGTWHGSHRWKQGYCGAWKNGVPLALRRAAVLLPGCWTVLYLSLRNSYSEQGLAGRKDGRKLGA